MEWTDIEASHRNKDMAGDKGTMISLVMP